MTYKYQNGSRVIATAPHLLYSSVQPHAALVAAVLSISSLIYFLATSTKVPICATLTTPSLKITVEINSDTADCKLVKYIQIPPTLPLHPPLAKGRVGEGCTPFRCKAL